MTVLWICIAIVAASIEPVVVKCGYASHSTPWQLLISKSIVGGLVILPLTRTFRWIGWAAFCRVFVLAALLLTTNALTLLSLTHISAVCLITIVTTTPAFVAIVNQMLGRDSLTGKFWIGFLCAFAGVLLGLDFHDLTITSIGLLLVLGAVASSTVYRVRSETTTAELRPALVSTYIFLINAAVALCVCPFVGVHFLTPTSWMYGSWMGLAAAAANVAFLFALSLLGSTRVSIINMLQRPLVVLAAAVILRERLNAFNVIGLVMVLAGIQLASVKRQKESARTTPSKHEAVAARVG
jgi:drug/metabolite transporter (DMT)-like permease